MILSDVKYPHSTLL